MKKILTLALVAAIVIVPIAVLADGFREPTVTEREAIKILLRGYFRPVIHGFGVGFTGDTYLLAKWHVVEVRNLPKDQIRSVIDQARRENVTDWYIIRDRLKVALDSNGTVTATGRIKIDETKYLLSNIQTTDTTLQADIKTLPNYDSCRQQNTTAGECENTATKVGDISLTKKSRAQEITGEPRVWAGTMNYNNVAYTFVTLAYPKSR